MSWKNNRDANNTPKKWQIHRLSIALPAELAQIKLEVNQAVLKEV